MPASLPRITPAFSQNIYHLEMKSEVFTYTIKINEVCTLKQAKNNAFLIPAGIMEVAHVKRSDLLTICTSL